MTLNIRDYPLLALVDYPQDLRQLPLSKLPELCQELRSFLLKTVSQSSGHLASGLGVVELTVALHYVYQTPFDKLVWDVGHQAYPHKILTGRRDKMASIRQKDGLHPFPWRGESEYDALSVGHSSTSIGAALGMAVAASKEHKGRKVAAIIGDGALTAGMAFEALNHGGTCPDDLLVILNDNDMSISENVGALNNSLAKLMSGQAYSSFRENSKKLLGSLPPIKELAKRTEEHLKGMVAPGTLFEEFGFNYIGPVDGHDVIALVQTLKNMRARKGPQFLHVLTKKGKGYLPAEQDPIGYHAVSKFDPSQENLPKKTTTTFSKVFGNWLCEMAQQDPKLMGITPAMREGSGMVEFSKRFANQYVDVAIAEQHALTFAAGLAIAGMHPVVAIYSTFLQRAYDQLIHDIAIQNLPVLLAIDRAGVVGADGPTHQGAFDLSFLRCVPNLTIMAPSDESECRQMLYTGYKLGSPAAVRYPRGGATNAPCDQPLQELPIGKAKIRREGKKTAILCFGPLLHEALKAAEKLNATVVDMRFIKPLDTQCIDELAKSHQCLVTLEDNAIAGGAGSAVAQHLVQNPTHPQLIQLGLPDHFIAQGTQAEVYAELGLDSAGIEQRLSQ